MRSQIPSFARSCRTTGLERGRTKREADWLGSPTISETAGSAIPLIPRVVVVWTAPKDRHAEGTGAEERTLLPLLQLPHAEIVSFLARQRFVKGRIATVARGVDPRVDDE